MEKKHLILLAESNLQSNLIKKQLSSIHDVDVKIMQPDEVVFRSHSLSIDLMFIDYDFMRQLEMQGKLPDFDLFGWSFMLHNVPCEKEQTDLLHWKLLKGILLRNA
ncbi:DNA-binding response regulator, partial [Vibrio parahaemolyticus]|nr:DNA-binding response regulator [Vibrio parahaemolyticus]